ncbi:MAG: diphosphomevalonate decarboxylase [Anaerolineaceae bacterium]|nr:diphosphomevalonate decarboxylase [Anaerolineaceae bacterium]
MPLLSATAAACPNIALIKYWGNKDHEFRIPENGSISFNLSGLATKTTVTFDPAFEEDRLSINDEVIEDSGLKRVKSFLKIIRQMSGKPYFAHVTSQNNYPMSVGIASSAAAFAALSVAASAAIGLTLSERELSRLARRGSGSACRSIPSGFVEWYPGNSDQNSYAESFASPDHWDLTDLIAVVTKKHKSVGSTAGHALAHTSPLQTARIADTQRRLSVVRHAILNKDFEALAEMVELDSNMMHAVMMTSNPPLVYWEPTTISIIKSVPIWRNENIHVCYTMDAGPNVHVICLKEDVQTVQAKLKEIPGIQDVLIANVGQGTRLITD